jgi:hypothetical protein
MKEEETEVTKRTTKFFAFGNWTKYSKQGPKELNPEGLAASFKSVCSSICPLCEVKVVYRGLVHAPLDTLLGTTLVS